MRGNDRLLTDERPIDGARAPPLLPCAADEFRFLDASVSDRRSCSLFCKGAARSNPSNRGDPFLASLRAIMGEGGMDKSAPPPAQLHAPPAQRGLFMFGKSFPTPGIHSRGGDPCVKHWMLVSYGEYDLSMAAASSPAGWSLPWVGRSHQRSGCSRCRCLAAEPEAIFSPSSASGRKMQTGPSEPK